MFRGKNVRRLRELPSVQCQGCLTNCSAPFRVDNAFLKSARIKNAVWSRRCPAVGQVRDRIVKRVKVRGIGADTSGPNLITLVQRLRNQGSPGLPMQSV